MSRFCRGRPPHRSVQEDQGRRSRRQSGIGSPTSRGQPGGLRRLCSRTVLLGDRRSRPYRERAARIQPRCPDRPAYADAYRRDCGSSAVANDVSGRPPDARAAPAGGSGCTRAIELDPEPGARMHACPGAALGIRLAGSHSELRAYAGSSPTNAPGLVCRISTRCWPKDDSTTRWRWRAGPKRWTRST